MENGLQTFPRLLIVKETDQPFFTRSPGSVSNRGVINIGDGVFDNISSGFFTGSTNGTALAVNVASGFAGNLADLQVNGASKFKINSVGTATLAGAINPAQSTPTYATPLSLDPTIANTFIITTTSGVGNATVNLASSPPAGESIWLIINNDAGGARTITFGTHFRMTSSSIIGTASKVMVVHCISDGTNAIEVIRTAAIT